MQRTTENCEIYKKVPQTPISRHKQFTYIMTTNSKVAKLTENSCLHHNWRTPSPKDWILKLTCRTIFDHSVACLRNSNTAQTFCLIALKPLPETWLNDSLSEVTFQCPHSKLGEKLAGHLLNHDIPRTSHRNQRDSRMRHWLDVRQSTENWIKSVCCIKLLTPQV